MPPYVSLRWSAYGGEVTIKSTESTASLPSYSLLSPRYMSVWISILYHFLVSPMQDQICSCPSQHRPQWCKTVGIDAGIFWSTGSSKIDDDKPNAYGTNPWPPTRRPAGGRGQRLSAHGVCHAALLAKPFGCDGPVPGADQPPDTAWLSVVAGNGWGAMRRSSSSEMISNTRTTLRTSLTPRTMSVARSASRCETRPIR